MSYIAGPYTAEAGGSSDSWPDGLNSLGCIEDGFSLEVTPSVQPINCDAYGDAIVDGVYRVGNMYIDFVLQEAELSEVQSLFWPFGGFGTVGTPGTLLSSYARKFRLTAITGSPAASGSFPYLSSASAILAPNYPLRLLYNSRLKQIPIRLQLLPFTYNFTHYFFRPVKDPTVAA